MRLPTRGPRVGRSLDEQDATQRVHGVVQVAARLDNVDDGQHDDGLRVPGDDQVLHQALLVLRDEPVVAQPGQEVEQDPIVLPGERVRHDGAGRRRRRRRPFHHRRRDRLHVLVLLWLRRDLHLLLLDRSVRWFSGIGDGLLRGRHRRRWRLRPRLVLSGDVHGDGSDGRFRLLVGQALALAIGTVKVAGIDDANRRLAALAMVDVGAALAQEHLFRSRALPTGGAVLLVDAVQAALGELQDLQHARLVLVHAVQRLHLDEVGQVGETRAPVARQRPLSFRVPHAAAQRERRPALGGRQRHERLQREHRVRVRRLRRRRRCRQGRRRLHGGLLVGNGRRLAGHRGRHGRAGRRRCEIVLRR